MSRQDQDALAPTNHERESRASAPRAPSTRRRNKSTKDYGVLNDEPDQSNVTDPATGGAYPMVPAQPLNLLSGWTRGYS